MKGVIIFGLGFVAGAIAGALYASKHSLNKEKVEIDFSENDIPEDVSENNGDFTVPHLDNIRDFQSSDFIEYHDILKDYTDKEVSDILHDPKIVSTDTANDLRDNEDYTVLSWTYFEGDKILADEMYKMVKDVDSVIGSDTLKMIGWEEEDILYVKDDRLKLIYEISAIEKAYKDHLLQNPYLVTM